LIGPSKPLKAKGAVPEFGEARKGRRTRGSDGRRAAGEGHSRAKHLSEAAEGILRTKGGGAQFEGSSENRKTISAEAGPGPFPDRSQHQGWVHSNQRVWFEGGLWSKELNETADSHRRALQFSHLTRGRRLGPSRGNYVPVEKGQKRVWRRRCTILRGREPEMAENFYPSRRQGNNSVFLHLSPVGTPT